jgi:hypothetical protein
MVLKRAPLAFAALAVFFSSVTNAHAHIHLCDDGEQPPVTIHGAQDTDHAHFGDLQHDDEPSCHDDVDVDLRGDGVAKSFKPDLPAVTSTIFFVLPAVVDTTEPPTLEPGTRRGPDPPHTRPPLRGPPLALA